MFRRPSPAVSFLVCVAAETFHSELPLSCEHRVRLAELAMQLTLASVQSANAWTQLFKNQPLPKDSASALQAFDLIYSHLLDKVGMDVASTAAPTSGPPTA